MNRPNIKDNFYFPKDIRQLSSAAKAYPIHNGSVPAGSNGRSLWLTLNKFNFYIAVFFDAPQTVYDCGVCI